MSKQSSLYWRIGFLLVLVGVTPWIALRLRRLAFFNNDFRDAGAVFAGVEPGTSAVRALHVFRNTLPALAGAGHACAPAGDADGDGCADLFVCAASDDGAGGGTVTLRSGATGAVLARWLLPDNELAPSDLRSLGDRDGDGTHELLLVQTGIGYLERTLAFTLDGASGRVLLDVFDGRSDSTSQRARVQPVGDLDGDGLADLCVQDDGGARVLSAFDGAPLPGPRTGTLRAAGRLDSRVDGAAAYPIVFGDEGWALVEGATGALVVEGSWAELALPVPAPLPTPTGPSSLPHLHGVPHVGRVLGVGWTPPATPAPTWVGDADGDGASDIALGCPWSSIGGEVPIVSSTGVVLARSLVRSTGAEHGAELLAWGADALLVGAPGEGALRLVSIADGTVLRTLRGGGAGGGFGRSLAVAGDVDGDGVDDLIVEEPGTTGVDADGAPWRGTVWVLSGADLR